MASPLSGTAASVGSGVGSAVGSGVAGGWLGRGVSSGLSFPLRSGASTLSPGVASKVSQPMPLKYSSAQAWASSPVTTVSPEAFAATR